MGSFLLFFISLDTTYIHYESSSSVRFWRAAKGFQRKIPCCHTLEERALRSTTLAPPLCFAPSAPNKITYFVTMTRTTRTAPREGKERWDDFFLLDRAPSLGLNAGLRVTLELLRDMSRRLDFFPQHTLPLLWVGDDLTLQPNRFRNGATPWFLTQRSRKS